MAKKGKRTGKKIVVKKKRGGTRGMSTTAGAGLCSFQEQPGDDNVTGLADSDLGFRVRMITEQGNGAWVFSTIATAKRLLREIPRTSA